MGSSDGPNAHVSTEVGITGMVLFSVLFVVTLVSWLCAKNKYSWRLFLSSSIMSLLELPRYIWLIVDEAYNNRPTYITHMWAGVFFFIAFTCVIYIMHDAVDLSQSHSPLTTMVTTPKSLVDRLVIDKTALVVLNIMFAIVTLSASISCVLYSNLEDFFHHSIPYVIFTIADVIKNLVVGAAFMFYGCRLRSRIHVFHETFGVSNSVSSIDELHLLDKLKKVVRRLLIVMGICLCSFTLRMFMLIIKGVTVEEDNIDISWLPSYGMLWWVLSDFIPRCLPILSFVIFFGGKSRARSRVSSKAYPYKDSNIRFSQNTDMEGNRAALLAGLESDDDEDLNPDGVSDVDHSSQGGSGHNYRHIDALSGRESINSAESCETTSTGFTVYRNTATTNEYSTSYRPHHSHHNQRSLHGNARPSESMMSGSVIVNALMWPISSTNRNSSANNLQQTSSPRSPDAATCAQGQPQAKL